MTLPEHYDPTQVEQETKELWTANSAYEYVQSKNEGGEPFYFVDGPPNTSGRMHCGTAWGKVLKDAFLRYYRMQGRDVTARPGYDTHGLPVERRLEAQLGVETKADVEEMGVEQFVQQCREYVEDQRQVMDEEFADLGVWMDWDDPYQTMDTEYMEVVWTAFRELYDRELLSRERRVVNTCPDCETSVAETRLSYETREATAAYVGFPLTDREGWLLTWTTTPWTVTANQFVAVDRDATYVAVDTPEKLVYVAADCLEDAMDELNVEYEVRERLTGETLLGWEYENPLADELPADAPSRTGTVAHAPYVELERTGLVHSAPGFGEEDYERGRELGLPAYAPVDETGTFRTDAVGESESATEKETDDLAYAGQTVDETRTQVLSDLDDVAALLGTHAHEHEYPQCPRCDTEVLYRATDQWTVQVTAFKDDLLEAMTETDWTPTNARENRFRTMVEDAPDWNVSRQRYWGTPVPVWTCESCRHDVVVESATELAERGDLDTVPEDLHRPTVDGVTLSCPECGGTATRETDVLDVWFDSAVASWASARQRPPETPTDWPADLLVEGHDQTRGWFLMQLYLGVAFTEQAPYEEVLMHGFATLDGKAMSKSEGHVLRPPEVVEQYGRDSLRGHLLSHNPTKYVNLTSDLDGVETVEDRLDVVWNVYRFALLYMDEHTPVPAVESAPTERTVLDDWLLSSLQATVAAVTEAMEERRTDRAFETALAFLVEDVSRYYVTAVRDRVWEGDQAVYDVLGTVLHAGVRLLAPFVPYLADRLYTALDGVEPTVHATEFPTVEDDYRDETVESVVERVRTLEAAVGTARQQAGRKRRWPVVEVVVETADETLFEAVSEHRELLERRLNARDVVVTRAYDRLESVVEPKMDELGPAFGEDADAVAATLREENVTAYPATVSVDGSELTVTSEMVEVCREPPAQVESAAFEYGTVYVDTTLTTSLKREGVYRDLLRRAQQLRDELDVGMDERVVLAVDSDETLVREAVETYRDELETEVRAERVVEETDDVTVSVEWSTGGSEVEVGARRAQ